jgi:hypothetical protein
MRPGPGQLAWQPDRQTLLAQDQQRVKDRRSGRLISFHRGAHRAHAPLRLFGSVAISRRATIVPWFHCTFN